MSEQVDTRALRAHLHELREMHFDIDEGDDSLYVHGGVDGGIYPVESLLRRNKDAIVAILNAAPALLDEVDALRAEPKRAICPQCYDGGTYVPNYHTPAQVEADEGEPDACPNPRWSPNADAGDYSSYCGCPEVPCTLCDKGAALRATQERDALRARVAQLEAENARLSTPLRPIVDRIHRALGCDERSDDESLPEMVETWVREHREKVSELEREVERVRDSNCRLRDAVRDAIETAERTLPQSCGRFMVRDVRIGDAQVELWRAALAPRVEGEVASG